MEKEIEEKYRKAGRILCDVKAELAKKIRPGVKLLDIAVLGEGMIAERGGGVVFPINISVNDIAAHYTPRMNDALTVNAGDLVKVDLGVHIDGYIVDSAFTYCSEKSRMIECAEKVADEAARIVRPGTKVSEIGQFIEESVERSGFGLITNLTGHGLERYQNHAPPTIPNTRNSIAHEVKKGDVIALEPFVTQSKGYVKDTSIVEIYNYLQHRPVRLPEARRILDMAKNEYHGLPFAKRWLCQKFSPIKVSLALRELEQVGALGTHPVLREAGGKPSAQAEHTIIVADKPVILTMLSE